MRAAIRLADRRGKFTGDLSRVQEFALTMMLWKEDRDREEALSEARLDSVKLALVASKIQTYEQMFPEYVAGEDHGGEYQSDINPDEAQRIEELLQSGGVLRLDEIGGE